MMTGLDFRSDADAVSPVIGVVLLVTISVLLAAVIGATVLGAEDALITTTPQASFEFDYAAGESGSEDLSTGGDDGALAITHVGGDSIDASTLQIRAAPGGTAGEGDLPSWSGDISAGVSASVTVDADATVRVVHSTSGSSTVVASWVGPDA
ncbi:type IV pilin N-terminal domain-containing protein [Haloarcula sp. S1CR25-12]|uniref:Type IV pilin N-terminal domain-containing protein n=1 Tax=Haloarcula saliterrae TaxID=2950534 RepID=A0ABU2F7S8_9EURY|nr:type IV pilin N-terminal domain-containing protein [Haloarcula sp. S1CR25-12]MDS0258312.1 type IV pilin N-terminal domain-containing protein [Haloarcula sp. S1CR25-12]